MKYVNTQTLATLEYSEIKEIYKNVSIPVDGTQSFNVDETTYALVELSAYPSDCYVVDTHVVLMDGLYKEVHDTREYTEEELSILRKAKVPRIITMRQARLQLLALGLLDDVEAVIANISDTTMKRAVQIEWEYAKEIERNSQTIGMLAQAVGMDDEALDNLFIEAAKL